MVLVLLLLVLVLLALANKKCLPGGIACSPKLGPEIQDAAAESQLGWFFMNWVQLGLVYFLIIPRYVHIGGVRYQP